MKITSAMIAAASVSLVQPTICRATSDDEAPVPLDPIEIVAEKCEDSGSVMPATHGSTGLFGGEEDPLEIPRALTIVTPERMEIAGVQTFADLSEVSPGAERLTYWGIAGSPELRGTHAGVFFDGMLRAWQRNEMPTSLGSCEALEIVRGPVPAQLSITPVGGYVDMIPKSPYFGEPHASVSFSAGSWDTYRSQIDAGGSTTAFGTMPAAWRVSISGQKAGSYYDNVHDDYVSLYATTIVQLDRRTTLSFGTEYYDHDSSEISGWNRVTQNLVDNSEYVTGESIDITDDSWGGYANRTLVTKSASTGIQDFSALVVSADVVQAALKAGKITQAAVDALLDLSDADDRARAYGQALPSTGQRDANYDSSGNSTLDALLAKAYTNSSSTSGYRYTREYFEKGGVVFTTKIDGSDILSDSRDYARSKDGLAFADWKRVYSSGCVLTDKFFAERLCTRKHSTYGFALNSDQCVVDDRLSLEIPVEAIATKFTVGAEGRYSWVNVTQDFFAEPFSRRDISEDDVSDNSVILTGSDEGADGLNLWSPGRGANLECNLAQGDVFALADTRIGERFRIYYGVRGEYAAWRTQLADEVERRTDALEASSRHVGDTVFANGSINPVYEFAKNWFWYGAAQTGTVLAPGDAGTVVGKANFCKANLLESGVKASLFDKKLYLCLDAYRWEQSRYSDLDARALPMRGVGIEAETAAEFEYFALTANYTFQRVRLLSDSIGYGATALSEEEWALSGGVLTATSDRVLENNPDRVYEGTPQHSANLTAIIKLPHGFGVAIGPHWRSAFYSSMDRTVRLTQSLVWNALLYWKGERLEISFRVRNITDEVYYYASDPVFSGNALVLRAEPINYEIAATYKF